MAAKISYEWTEKGNSIIIRKSKGLLTVEDIFRFLHERDQVNAFDGALAVICFRVSGEREPFFLDDGKENGDAQEVYMIGDDELCPICGENKLFPQYCPACGEKIKEPKEE